MRRPRRPGLLPLLLILLACQLAGCAGTPQSRALLSLDATDAQVLEGIPFHPQRRYHCGPAALATVLGASGLRTAPDALAPRVYVPGRRGSFAIELMAAAREHGRLAYPLAPALEDLLAEIRAGHPVLVLQNLGLGWLPQWHFAVVKGFDLARGQLILNSGQHENYAIPLPLFERTWARADHWAALVLAPADLPATAEPGALLRALLALEGNDPEAALAGYEASLARWPRQAPLHMGYANLLHRRNRTAEAEAVFRQLLADQPDYAPAYNNLAQLLLERGELAEAERLAREALRLGGEFRDSYGNTLRMIQKASP